MLKHRFSCLSYFSLLPCVFSQTEAHLDTLISEQASFILARSGVGSLYTVYQENRSQRVRKCTTMEFSFHPTEVFKVKNDKENQITFFEMLSTS